MPMMACAVTDLPEPDSPRMARVSPGSRSKLTPLTALATPSRVRNSTCRFSTSRTGVLGSSLPRPVSAELVVLIVSWVIAGSPKLRVEGVAESVAEQHEGEHGDRQRH